MSVASLIDRVLLEVERAADEAVAFTADMIRIPTVNPPGEVYEDCARFIGQTLQRLGFDIEYLAAEGRPEHTVRYPRLNVIGTRRGLSSRPTVHLNGHFDVVPAGEGWSVDPFGGLVRDGRIYGRGACDMKAGIAAAVFAAEAIRRAGVPVPGTIEVSGTVDEESGGFAGVAWLAEHGRLSAHPHRLSASSRNRSTSIASASGIAASTGSRWRRGGTSRTAACRSSVSAPSKAWVTCCRRFARN